MWLFWEEVFRSFDSARADHAVQVLRDAGIAAQRRAINLTGSAMSANRGRMGSFGINERYRYVYAVRVSRRDVSLAKHLLHDVQR